MSTPRIPQADPIEELAKFWNTHDLTEFEDELEEVAEPVFERQEGVAVTIRLQPKEFEAVKRIAMSRGVEQTTLIRQWVLEKIQAD